MITLSEIYTPNPVCLDVNSTINDALKEMRKINIGCVCVCENGSLVGIFSERDLVRYGEPDIFNKPISEYMTKDVATAGPNDFIESAERIMREGGFRHLPILENGKLVGMVSSKDLFAACHNAEMIRRKQIEAINAMVITYSHEIRNPLTIILGKIRRAEPKDVAVVIQDAGARINKVLDKINNIEQVELKNYTEKNKMFDLDKSIKN